MLPFELTGLRPHPFNRDAYTYALTSPFAAEALEDALRLEEVCPEISPDVSAAQLLSSVAEELELEPERIAEEFSDRTAELVGMMREAGRLNNDLTSMPPDEDLRRIALARCIGDIEDMLTTYRGNSLDDEVELPGNLDDGGSGTEYVGTLFEGIDAFMETYVRPAVNEKAPNALEKLFLKRLGEVKTRLDEAEDEPAPSSKPPKKGPSWGAPGGSA